MRHASRAGPRIVAGWLHAASAAGGLAGSACTIEDLREDDVGDAPACEAARLWPHEAAEREDRLHAAIDRARARGAICGDRTANPVAPVLVSPELHCAARMHAADLAEHGTLSHTGSDGSTPQARVKRAGYMGIPKAELLAEDFTDVDAVLTAWVESPGHCTALFDLYAAELGIGHVESRTGANTAWVLVTGEERSP